MMKENTANGLKKKISLAAILIVAVLSSLTFLFVNSVKKQLWEQSVSSIIESTLQGCNTLRLQLSEAFDSMETAAEHLSAYSLQEQDSLDEMLYNYSQTEGGISLYLPDGCCISEYSEADEEVKAILMEGGRDSGIIDPHISSITGVNVFNQFVKVKLKDGTAGYLVKEYEVDQIVDNFSLSFYQNHGFSYVVNTKGDVLIRSPHPNSNKTVQNLFDMLPESRNDKDSLALFSDSLKSQKTGWAVFDYQNENTVFCYVPLKLQSDWYLISIIPTDTVNAQTNQIVKHSLALIGSIILGIGLLAGFYLRYAGRANRRLRNQADYIGHLYNAVPEGIALLSAELPYHIIQLNQEGLRLLGYPEGSTNESPCGRLLETIISPDNYETVLELFDRVSVSDEKENFESRMTREDGSLFWAGGIIEKTLDEEGSPILIAAFHDITKEKMEEEAAEREKLLERNTLVVAISNAYPVIIRLNLTKDLINFIYVKEELVDGLGTQTTYSEYFKDMEAVVHPDHLEEFRDRFSPEHLRNTLGPDKHEVFLEIRKKLVDQVYHWVSTQIIYVNNPYSEDHLAILISRCIDEQRRDEERQRQFLQSALDNARAASEAKSQFLSNMSHDIRTPMNAIIGMTAVAAAHISEPDRVKECLNKISRSNQYLLSLINDILDMSKIESGKLTFREEPFNFAELISEVTELVRQQAAEKKLTITVHLSALEHKNAVGDPLRVRQVFLNILSNAIKYTLDGGSIHVEAAQEPSSISGYESFIFRCTDTGVGMSGDFLNKLFLPFERAQDSTISRVTGTGLGMAITKNLVDLMNGEILVESQPGKGSVFTVIIPLQIQAETPDKVPDEWLGARVLVADGDMQADKSACTGKRILLVEDNEINREIARELIGETGVQIEEACDGEEAVRMVSAAPEAYYDLIFMDIQMPVMDGYTAAETIRRLSRNDVKNLPIIAMTANAFDEDVRSALRAGMNAHLAKPVDVDALNRLLQQYLG